MGHFGAVKLSPRRTTKHPCFVCFVAAENYKKNKSQSFARPGQIGTLTKKRFGMPFYQRNRKKPSILNQQIKDFFLKGVQKLFVSLKTTQTDNVKKDIRENPSRNKDYFRPVLSEAEQHSTSNNHQRTQHERHAV